MNATLDLKMLTPRCEVNSHPLGSKAVDPTSSSISGVNSYQAKSQTLISYERWTHHLDNLSL